MTSFHQWNLNKSNVYHSETKDIKLGITNLFMATTTDFLVTQNCMIQVPSQEKMSQDDPCCSLNDICRVKYLRKLFIRTVYIDILILQ